MESLKIDILRNFARLLGKEDPAIAMAEQNDRTAEGKSQFVWAIKDINFDVNRGEIIGIIGKNGAGKSTLLKILSRVATPTMGSVKIRGRVSSLLEVGSGFHPELTGRENIYLNGSILGMRRKELDKKLDAIVDFSGVERYIDTPVKRYSSGMYVRLAFAVAAHLDPDILIVDEVLAVGDDEFQKKAIGKMKEVSSKDGRTIIIVSHSMSTISKFATRSILLHQGMLSDIGPTENIIEKYLTTAVRERRTSYEKAQIDQIVENTQFMEEDFFDVNYARMCDKDGISKDRFSSDEKIFFKIGFSVFKKLKGFRLLVLISNKDGVEIMSSNFVEDPYLLKYETIDTGEYNWSCILPENLFGETKFFVSISVYVPYVQHRVFDHIFSFTIDYKGYNGILRLTQAASPIKLQVPWTEK